MEDTIYTEKQRLASPWIWVAFIPLAVVYLYGISKQLFFGVTFGPVALPDWLLAFTGVIVLAMMFVLYRLELHLELRKDGIYFRYWMVQKEFRRVPLYQIEGYCIRNLKDPENRRKFGNNGNVINLDTGKSEYGIELDLKNGAILLIGTSDPEKFINYLERRRIRHYQTD